MLPYHINSDEFERAYKNHLSDFRTWAAKEHAEKWLVYPENIGRQLCIDETSLSRGELYTIVSNPEAHCRKGSLVAVVKGTKAEEVIRVLKENICESKRLEVKEMTMDYSTSMEKIARCSFPDAKITIDRFHIQKGCFDALMQVRSLCLQEAREREVEERKIHQQKRKEYLLYEKYKHKSKVTFSYIPPKTGAVYKPFTLRNGDTVCELLVRSHGLLMTAGNQWTDSQKERAALLFHRFPRLKEAYSLTHSLRMIFSNPQATAESARESILRWCQKAVAFQNKHFATVAHTIEARLEDILHYFDERHTNAYAESLNAKIKTFRAALRGVKDVKFFLYRLSTIFS